MDKRRIIEKVHPLIVASINKYAIGKGEFEDLYQEGIVKILELLKEFDEDKGVNIFYYLKLNLRFFYLNYGRYERETVSLNTPISEGTELKDMIMDEGQRVEDIALQKLYVEYAYKAIQELKHEDRYIIHQLIIKGKTLDAVAKDLGISRTTLFRRKETAIKRMREHMDRTCGTL